MFMATEIKYWENWKSLSSAKSILSRRNCWTCCDECKKKWIETKTANVHMRIKHFPNTQPVTRFICDACLIAVKEESSEAESEEESHF